VVGIDLMDDLIAQANTLAERKGLTRKVTFRVGARRFRGKAEVITDPSRLADFMEVRLERHPRMIGLIMEKAHGLPRRPTRAQLEELAKTGALVIVHPTGMLPRRSGWSDNHGG